MMFDRLFLERLELLAGVRGPKADKAKAAVRLEDLRELLTIAPDLKSTHAAGDPPTEAEYNALVDDVKMIHLRLKAIAAALQSRLLP